MSYDIIEEDKKEEPAKKVSKARKGYTYRAAWRNIQRGKKAEDRAAAWRQSEEYKAFKALQERCMADIRASNLSQDQELEGSL